MKIFLPSGSVFSEDWSRIVFANKNHNYGAYQLRHNYNYRLLVALLIGSSILITAFGSGYFLSHKKNIVFNLPKRDSLVITTPPPIDIIRPPVQSHQEQRRSDAFPLVSNDSSAFTQPKDTSHISFTGNGSGNDTSSNHLSTNNGGSGTGGNGSGNNFHKDTTVTWAQVMPEFPGGEKELLKFLKKKIKTNSYWQQDGNDGTIAYQFVVAADGSIRDVTIKIDKVFFGLADLNKGVIAGMPQWKPGLQNGHPVNVLMCLPIKFQKEEW